jgi:hypothetical protein
MMNMESRPRKRLCSIKKTLTIKKRKKNLLKSVKSSKKMASFCPTLSLSDNFWKISWTLKFSRD